MMQIRKNIALLSSFVFLVLLFACEEDKIGENDTGTLTGVVVASVTNMPIANARISTQPISSTVFTDENGEFVITDIPVGEYSVEARADGYLAAFEPAVLTGSNTPNVILELEISNANNMPPTVPRLVFPVDNSTVEDIEVTFQWRASDPDNDPINYTLELRNITDNEIFEFENIADTSYTYSPLTLGATYVWQVTATDDVNEPVISPLSTFDVINAPSDNRFLFVRTIDDNNVIFSSDGTDEFRLTSLEKNSYRPRRNVAAGRIAFMQNDGAEVHLYTMNLDGTNKQKITNLVRPNGFKLSEINFSWPPTSDKIYFPNYNKLYRINTNGQGLELVYQTPDGSFISEVDVSDDETVIALKTNNQNGYDIAIYTIDFNGNVLTDVLSGVDGAASGLDLSVTKNLVLYSYDISGFESDNYRRLASRLFVYDIAAATAINISGDNSAGGFNDLDPIFSPNEAEAIFTRTSNDGISQRDVYTINVDLQTGSGERLLKFEDAFMPDWE
ncbi:MAG: hypothetical protein CMC08_01520 [Flavobacteriaceae bacterium]|nr:hypothetical protein [Flavobacteriaceae bacterium]